MSALAPRVALSEPDVEAVVLGSIIQNPEAMLTLSGTFDLGWFTDPATRAFGEAAVRLHRDGHRITPAALIAGVSPEVEAAGLTRSAAVAHLMGMAVPLTMLSGPLAVLRDRWARRILASEADELRRSAEAIDVDPFEAAAGMVGVLDTVSVARGERAEGSLGQGVDRLLDAIASPETRRGATTGLDRIDAKLNGYMRGKLYVIAGRPGMGKSAFSCSSLRRTAAAGYGIAKFSLEMSQEEISARCISDVIDDARGPFFGNILRGLISDADVDQIGEAREALRSLPFHVDASPRLTMSEIGARVRRVKAAYAARGVSLDVIAIDHMGLVEPSDRYRGNKVAEGGEISRAAKILAKELDCCVILLCQLSREVEKRDDKRPTLADLRWSGEIEQDADVVAFLFRPAYYLEADPACDPDALLAARHRLEFLIRKNRNGECGDVPLWCSIAHSSIRDHHHG